MILALLCIVCVIVGLIVGYYARAVHNMLVIVIQQQAARLAESKKPEVAPSMVITTDEILHPLEIENMPDYLAESAVVRPPNPLQLKKIKDAAFEKEKQNFQPENFTGRIL